MDIQQHLAAGGGICGTCLEPAAATYENQGYSSCCNDRIEYDGEAQESIRMRAVQEAEDAGAARIVLLGSWGQDEREAFLIGETVYNGKPAILVIDEDGFEGLKLSDTEGQHYGWKRIAS